VTSETIGDRRESQLSDEEYRRQATAKLEALSERRVGNKAKGDRTASQLSDEGFRRQATAEPEAPRDETMGDRTASQLSDEEFRRQATAELEELRQRVAAQAPDYEPPPFSPRRLMALVEEILDRLPLDARHDVLERLRAALSKDLFDLGLWRGVWYMANYLVQYNANLVTRRFRGEFSTDEWGLDWEFVDAMRPFLRFLYRVYWRVETTGLEHVPVQGRALLVAHHSGQLPWDGVMIGMAILTEHPAQRLVRTLYAALLARLPYVAPMLARLGQVLATVDNGTRLLEQDELVVVFPEGYKGVGKTFRDRYRLARFGRGGFVRMALSTGAPIIPVSVVGAEETYITLAKVPTLSRITGVPYLPITLTFPLFGLLGFVPLPTKWTIDFGEPIPLDHYGPNAADDLVLVTQLSDQVRNTIQEMLHSRLAQRRSLFFG
jgi:1-acyl-sn-glycerol-3-phosphate acyltransferase